MSRFASTDSAPARRPDRRFILVAASAMSSMLAVSMAPRAAAQDAGASGRRGVSQANAAEVYRTAFAQLDGSRPRSLTPEEYSDLVDLTAQGRIMPQDVERVRELLGKVAPFLEAVAPAGTMRRSDFGLDLGEGFDLRLPHLSQMRTTARLLRAQAALAIQDGDWETSLASMQSLEWLGNHAGQDRTLISSLVGTATTSLSLAPLDALLDDGTLTQERAAALLEAMRGVRGEDPFGYGDAMRGEFRLLEGTVNGRNGDEVAALLQGTGDALKGLDERGIARELGRARGAYELAAKAFSTDDPEQARALMDQVDREMERSPLLKALMPSIARALRSKQTIEGELAARIERLEAIAKGKKKALELANASTWFRRAAAFARGIPEDGQAALALELVGGRAIDPSLLDRAERLHLGAGRSIRECLERGLACGVVDFDVPNDHDFGLSGRWLPGLRGACRVMLARAMVAPPAERAELASIVVGAVAALTRDPSILRSVVARSIVDDALPVLRMVAAERSSLDAAERDALVASIQSLLSALQVASSKGLDADRDRLSTGSAWSRTVDPRRRKIMARRGPDFVLFLQLAMAPRDAIPVLEETESTAKGALVQFDDILPPGPCAEAIGQADAVQQLRFFDALRFGPDPDADERDLGAFRGVREVPIRDHGKDLADLSTSIERLGVVLNELERTGSPAPPAKAPPAPPTKAPPAPPAKAPPAPASE